MNFSLVGNHFGCRMYVNYYLCKIDGLQRKAICINLTKLMLNVCFISIMYSMALVRLVCRYVGREAQAPTQFRKLQFLKFQLSLSSFFKCAFSSKACVVNVYYYAEKIICFNHSEKIQATDKVSGIFALNSLHRRYWQKQLLKSIP